MKVIKSVPAMQQYSLAAKKHGKIIGVVPTMGYLHAGHTSLIDLVRAKTEIVIVTIFVNPTQFGANEDLSNYPRDFERDLQLCEQHGADVVFAPEPDDMYCADRSVWVIEEKLSRGLCGRSRPEHFRGVTTVVAKLFNITLPDVAIFGQKDAQQALVLQRMVRDLNFPVEVIVAPIVREADGLAMSSRNRYLSENERKSALCISRSLFNAELQIKKNGLAALGEILSSVWDNIREAGGAIDYVEGLDADTLEPVTEHTVAILIAVAAGFGRARLLDNILVKIKD
ncbi:MAG: pantoate--beta-alanine ligase [Victivallaceae bacterium]